MAYEFVHCNLHSEYSLFDSTSRIKDIISKAENKGMTSVALTDHNNMYGAIEFYQKSKASGIKPLLGYEAYVAPNGRLDKTSEEYYNIVLLAKSYKGYQNITKMISASHTEGFYNVPRIDKELLEKCSKDVIALSACSKGEIFSYLLQDNYEKALKTALFYKEVFGENYYLEISDHGTLEQKKINPIIFKLGKDTGIKVVATNDCHYTNKEDALAREVLRCIKNGTKLEDRHNYLEGGEHYIKSPEEMYNIFKEIPEVLRHTLEIEEKCNLIIPMGNSILPNFPLPDSYTAESYLQKIAFEGLKTRYKEITPEISKRFFYEIDMINKMGFPSYFLIVSDYINYARKKGIQVGAGMYFSSGSIVCFALGITDIDPLPYNLLFERFLNPERVSMPDVDTSFCFDRKDEVIQYIAEKYGYSKVSKIITLETLDLKELLIDVSKVINYDLKEAEKLVKMIPEEAFSLKDVLEEVEDLKIEVDNNQKVKDIIDITLKLENLSISSSFDSNNLIISKDPLNTIIPLEKNNEGFLLSQFKMMDIEKLGLLNIDLFGLKYLTVISNTLDSIKKNRGFELNLDNIPLDDKKTYELLESANTIGVFQLESEGMIKFVSELKPTFFGEIIDLISLYRPGPLGSGIVEDFINRKHGKQKIEYLHPYLESILKDTYGLIIYQEQIMQIAQIIAGFSLGQGDLLRKEMCKKNIRQMIERKEEFLFGSSKNGISNEIANSIFDVMERFSEYCFYKSHAAAYAMTSYKTAYLKAHYPVEYMSILISTFSNNSDKVLRYRDEVKRMGIEIL